MSRPGIFEVDWPAPAGVIARWTTRQGGCSAPPYDSFNLAAHVGDAPEAVRANRHRLQQHLPAGCRIQWLQQVHGIEVFAARAGDAPDAAPRADASCTRERGLACAIMTADCLPVLFCDRSATVVAAAHAGWRGMAGGVLEATVAAMGVPAQELLAWLGPAIGPAAFEVGAEVKAAFCDPVRDPDLRSQFERGFVPGPGPGHFLADLCHLARVRLAHLGLTAVYGGGACTYSDALRFFSYRRDGDTGRMAALVALQP